MGKRLIRKYDNDGNLISMECSKCHEIKEVGEFPKDKSKKDGVRTICKKCSSEYNKEYCKQNAYKLKEQKKEYYKQNADKMKKKHAEYSKQNADKIKEYHAEYYKQNVNKIKERDAERYNSKVEQSLVEIKVYVEKEPQRFNYNPSEEIYGIIYLVYNNKSQRYYVGQTTNSFDIRYQSGWLYGHIHKDTVKEDLEKYGEDSFEYTKIFKVAHNQEELDKLEAYYIEYFDSYENGYNDKRGNVFTEREEN